MAADEDTEMLSELCWARVLVRLGDSKPKKSVEVMVGKNRFVIQLWWEFSPSLKVDLISKKKRKFRLCKEDDGGARTGESACLGGCVMQLIACSIGAVGDVLDKSPVVFDKSPIVLDQTQRWSSGQSPSQFLG